MPTAQTYIVVSFPALAFPLFPVSLYCKHSWNTSLLMFLRLFFPSFQVRTMFTLRCLLWGKDQWYLWQLFSVVVLLLDIANLELNLPDDTNSFKFNHAFTGWQKFNLIFTVPQKFNSIIYNSWSLKIPYDLYWISMLVSGYRYSMTSKTCNCPKPPANGGPLEYWNTE